MYLKACNITEWAGGMPYIKVSLIKPKSVIACFYSRSWARAYINILLSKSLNDTLNIGAKSALWDKE